MLKLEQQPKDELYKVTSTKDKNGIGRRRIAIVGDPGRSFHDEGLVLLDLEGKILAVFNKNTKEVKKNEDLTAEEDRAAYFLGEAYKQLADFYSQRREEPNFTETKYLAATLAIPLKEIRQYFSRKPLSEILSRELAVRFGVYPGLARCRVETLGLENPDTYLDITGRYERRYAKFRRLQSELVE